MEIRTYARQRRERAITWFEFGLAMFAAALPIGLVLLLAAPLSFFHFLGAIVVGTGLIGVWVSALGLQLEYPERWHALKASIRRLGTAESPPRGYADR